MVLTLFGKYHGTIKKSGFFLVNPFASAFNPGLTTVTQPNGQRITVGSKTVSMKVRTLDNQKQKVNDILGNPIIIGAVVIWKVVDPTRAVFAVENYNNFLSIQCDSTIRNIARLYPYDDMDDNDGVDEKTLRGSSQEIADRMKEELQTRVADAGIEVIEVRITHLSYSEEIAAAMLQRQQAVAIIAARKKIVEGAVSMVEMAIDQLSENQIVNLDDERKAQMVSNLMVVLCGNKDSQPVIRNDELLSNVNPTLQEKVNIMGNTDKKNTDNSALEKKQILLRLSPSLHSDLAKWAEDDFRSINGQIEYLLSEAVKKRKGTDQK